MDQRESPDLGQLSKPQQWAYDRYRDRVSFIKRVLDRKAAPTPVSPVARSNSVAGSGVAISPVAVMLPVPESVNGEVGGTVGCIAPPIPAAASAPTAMLKMPVPPVIVRLRVIAELPIGSGAEFKPVNDPVKEFPPPKLNVKVPLTERVPSGFGTAVPLAENCAVPNGVKTARPEGWNWPGAGPKIVSPFWIVNDRTMVSARTAEGAPK